jgi:hypothetical protein
VGLEVVIGNTIGLDENQLLELMRKEQPIFRSN